MKTQKGTSLSLESIVRLQSRKERERTGCFFADGTRFVSEALATGAAVETVVVSPTLIRGAYAQRLVRTCRDRRIPVLEVSAFAFDRISLATEMQGLGAVVRQNWCPLSVTPSSLGLCWLALETVQSPGNLGTVIRTCDAVGAAGVIFLGPSIDPFDPACVRATMGSIFSVKLIRSSHGAFASWKRRSNLQVVGTSAAADIDYRQARYPGPTVLMLGCERKGLSVQQLDLCDMVVSIPMVGRADSLNLGVAAGVMLYEVFGQRSAKRPGTDTITSTRTRVRPRTKPRSGILQRSW